MRGSVSVQDGSGWVRNRSWCCHHRWKFNATGMPICYFSLPQMFNVHVKTVVRRTLPSKHPGFRLKHNIRFLRTPTSHQQAASRIQIEHSYLDHPSPMGLVLRILAPRTNAHGTDRHESAHMGSARQVTPSQKTHTQPGANSPSSGAMSVNAVDSTLGQRFSEQDYLQGST